jgi:hypothetical protein
MPIEFVPYTEECRRAYARWLAGLTRTEVRDYAERKMMPVRYLFRQWKQARHLQRRA